MSFHKGVQRNWLDLIYNQKKDIEGRCGSIDVWIDKIGTIGDFFDPLDPTFNVMVKLINVEHFDTLDSYLEKYWERCAPHCISISEAKQAYLDIIKKNGTIVFGPERIIRENGIVALFIKKI